MCSQSGAKFVFIPWKISRRRNGKVSFAPILYNYIFILTQVCFKFGNLDQPWTLGQPSPIHPLLAGASAISEPVTYVVDRISIPGFYIWTSCFTSLVALLLPASIPQEQRILVRDKLRACTSLAVAEWRQALVLRIIENATYILGPCHWRRMVALKCTECSLYRPRKAFPIIHQLLEVPPPQSEVVHNCAAVSEMRRLKIG
jgi:hypothetical protein